MSVIKKLIRTEKDGGISFGNYKLDQKSKVSDFEYEGDVYKVKTFREITRLERNGMFVYESVPGTAVTEMKFPSEGVEFTVEADEDVQITLGMEDDTEYKVLLDDVNVGHMTTGLGGKLSFSVELEQAEQIRVKIVRLDQ